MSYNLTLFPIIGHDLNKAILIDMTYDSVKSKSLIVSDIYSDIHL